jgi:uncharacterized protein
MSKHIFSFLQFILFFLPFLGGKSIAQEASVRAYPMEERSLLWKIEGNGIKTESYLFGTIHLIDESDFYFPKKLEKILSKSEVLTMEIGGIPDPRSVMKLMQLSEGSFFDFFTQEQTDSLLIWVEEHTSLSQEAFEKMVDNMRPFVVSQLLTELDDQNPSAGMDNKKSYEVELEVIAKEEKLEIAGLETVEEQLGFFDQLPIEVHTEMVMHVLRTDSLAVDETELIVERYLAQDVDGLYALIAESSNEVEGMQELLIDTRNGRWIPIIEAMIAEKSTFIAVGSGHLGGPNGVIRLLEQLGYTLTPIEL